MFLYLMFILNICNERPLESKNHHVSNIILGIFGKFVNSVPKLHAKFLNKETRARQISRKHYRISDGFISRLKAFKEQLQKYKFHCG